MNGRRIIFKNVSKTIEEQTVLKDINLEIPERGIYGIVGRNGSGKTVLIKCLCGFMSVTEGEIWVGEKQVGRDVEFVEDIGFIIETPGFLPRESGYRNLKYLASIRNVAGKERIRECITMVGLDPDDKKWVGKTVLIKCLCGFMSVTEGEIWVGEKQVGRDVEFVEDIGFIIETPGFLPRESGYRNLKYLASIRNVAGKERIRECITMVGLDPDDKKWVGKYSLGMRQRLGIAQAIMENPSLIILDEPMNGLDNHGVEEIRKLLLGLKEEGKLILIISHNREDIRLLCDRVYEMDMGVLTQIK